MKHIARTRIPGCTVILLFLGAALPVFAHHSTAQFNTGKTITLTGTVTDIVWGNPHTLVFIDAKDPDLADSPVKNWNLELPSPSAMAAKGFKSDTVKVGDKVIVLGNRSKDGKPNMLLLTITDAAGKSYALREP